MSYMGSVLEHLGIPSEELEEGALEQEIWAKPMPLSPKPRQAAENGHCI